MEAGGKEMFSSPQVEGMLSSSFFKITGMHNLGVSLFSDEDTSLISPQGMESFLGHFPAGSSF